MKLNRFESHFECGAFTFVEGSLVKGIRAGVWILLDEINLANAATLQRLNALLDGQLTLFEKTGDVEVIKPHPNFRLMANMNPPTDFGKKVTLSN